MTDVTTDLQNYEIMLLLSSEIGEEGAKKELDDLHNLISSSSGKLKNENFIGLKELAYTIKKQDRGFYVVLNLELPTEKTSEFEKLFNINNAILRYLFLKVSANHQMKGLTEYVEAEKVEKVEEPHLAKEPKSVKEPAESLKKKTIVKKTEVEEKNIATKAEQAETKVEPAEAEPAEAKIETAPKKKAKKASEEKSKLDELDEKLKSIINNPDISL